MKEKERERKKNIEEDEEERQPSLTRDGPARLVQVFTRCLYFPLPILSSSVYLRSPSVLLDSKRGTERSHSWRILSRDADGRWLEPWPVEVATSFAENSVPGIRGAFLEKHRTRINQPVGKLICVSIGFAYQWPRHRESLENAAWRRCSGVILTNDADRPTGISLVYAPRLLFFCRWIVFPFYLVPRTMQEGGTSGRGASGPFEKSSFFIGCDWKIK